MDEVLHLDVQHVRLLGVLDIKRIKAAVLRNHRHVRLTLEPSLRGLHADNVLRTIGLARHDVGRTQVNVGHCRREYQMHRLVKGHLQSVRRNHAVISDTARQTLKEVTVLWQFCVLCAYCTRAHQQGTSHHHYFLHSHSFSSLLIIHCCFFHSVLFLVEQHLIPCLQMHLYGSHLLGNILARPLY